LPFFSYIFIIDLFKKTCLVKSEKGEMNMPIYEYECASCGVFEQKQSIKEDALKECPTCKGEVRRLISRNVGVIYKGSGFYTTDTRTAPAEKAPACGDAPGCGGCPNAS
jgi:putative FmdB family regulatory protein